ncbi:DUF3152 domain-containing protein [Demequina sp. SYSU T00192]|uniref:DUF3152 domain-containing protein n=1 Tax=Demequina litoralis TaxID=3051660 RepID=A0ABT8G729_9MICO|nr:DUF3152 domain-containing protein [Demequina sp. SYSU T00192]MDN4474946.1 DUF3152 domain-containing protein [Demequina sp. SYSU T00192]
MTRRSGGLFAGRGIALPGLVVTLVTVLACFAVGIGAGWLTGQVPGWYRAWSAEPEPTVSASPSESPEPEVSLPALEPITRELDGADAAAGVVTTTVPERGEGTFTTASTATRTAAASASPDAAEGPTRYVRIDVEDGVTVDEDAFVDYVMRILQDERGWGSAGRLQFVMTDGAADVQVVLATPYTVATRCPDEPEGDDPTCAEQGIVPLSVYDWTAGLGRYGDNRKGARAYLLNNGVGHVLGEESATCTSGRASVMVDQTRMPKACNPNGWPFPDAATSG